MSATPWRPPMPSEGRQLLIEARRAHVEDGYKACLAGVIQSAVDAGWSLQEIGDICGFTREYARQLDALKVDERELTDFPAKPRRPRKGAPARWTPPAVRVARELPQEQVDHLRNLYAQARNTNGATPVGHPSRIAGDELWRRVNDLIASERLTATGVATTLGITPSGVNFALGRRGYRSLPPSMSDLAYANRKSPGGTRPKKSHCKRGHEFTATNTITTATGRACRTCRNAGALARYYAQKETTA